MAFAQQISLIVQKNSTLIYGTLCNGQESEKRKSHFFQVVNNYFQKPLINKPLIIEVGDQTVKCKTDENGFFTSTLEGQYHPIKKISLEESGEAVEIMQDYPTTFIEKDSNLAAISDIDDTIIVSHTAKNLKRIREILRKPSKRLAIDFSSDLLNKIASQGEVYYVSRSEVNLFPLLSSVIGMNDLPKGPLFMTKLVLGKRLLKPRKDPAHKKKSIQKILFGNNDKRFVLLGDDTQQDMHVYLEVAEEYPNRIKKIFIRKTGRVLSKDQRDCIKKLEMATVPFHYFNVTDDSTQELNTLEL